MLQELLAYNITDKPYYYLTSSTNNDEIEFIFNFKNTLSPLEVKAGKNTSSKKSFNNFVKEYSPEYSFVISQANFNFTKKYYQIPLYAIGCLKDL